MRLQPGHQLLVGDQTVRRRLHEVDLHTPLRVPAITCFLEIIIGYNSKYQQLDDLDVYSYSYSITVFIKTRSQC